MEENKTVECILRSQNANFNKDIKVDLREDLLEDDSWEFQDIYDGASQTLLQAKIGRASCRERV